MKRSHLLGRSLAIAPLVLGLALGTTGIAAAATPLTTTPATASVSHPAAVHAAGKHVAAKHAVHKKVVHKKAVHKKVTHKKVAHATTPATATAATPAPVAAVALTPFEARMVFLVNQARAANGVAALTVVAGATDVARRWALVIAGNDALSHNPLISQDLQAAGSPNWTFIAENVGSGPANDADGLFAAYMASPHHRANILDPRAVEIGMGAVTTPEPEGDTTYNTMDFVNSYDTSYGPTETNAVATELPLASLASALN